MGCSQYIHLFYFFSLPNIDNKMMRVRLFLSLTFKLAFLHYWLASQYKEINATLSKMLTFYNTFLAPFFQYI